tara:strand:+ start:301 stop:855 length:555 start_codon:yes stop_codon:yes gene_type:complete
MKKILIAIDNDFIREAYHEVFKAEDFEVWRSKSGEKVSEIVENEKPDIIILDISLPEMQGFQLMRALKTGAITKGIPIIIFAQLERREDRLKAMELEAKDFITAASVSPAAVVRKVKILLGEQKSYFISLSQNSDDVSKLVEDLNYNQELKCQKCGGDLGISLTRDLSVGTHHFILNFVCPKCG